MSQFAVIIPAAGKSSRFKNPQRKKPFMDLKGRPVWLRAAEPFANHDDVAQTIIVVSPDDIEWFRDKYRPNLAFMNVVLVEGGKERADSVANGLAHVKETVDYVAVHDAARPLITKQAIDVVFSAAEKHGAAIPALPVSSTVKRVKDDRISETVPREDLWLAQTPQVCKREWLAEAFEKRGDFQPTDEAQLLERIGKRVAIVEGSPWNIKLTTAEDLRIAQALVDIVEKQKDSSILHPFASDNPHWFSE
ncbi:MAG: 2-C-methyl-D-erythritol 4-phosphate cytidylyltransferase [Planctomycetaceae bacterium]|nr:2-C-methyl-D-erythritol 4-phosphate cytidylyltransferase [Planctomycetaceae bacterium]